MDIVISVSDIFAFFLSVSSANEIMFGGEIDLQTNHLSIWIHGHRKERFCSSSHTHTQILHRKCTQMIAAVSVPQLRGNADGVK